jgi:hypothetical protein
MPNSEEAQKDHVVVRSRDVLALAVNDWFIELDEYEEQQRTNAKAPVARWYWNRGD